MNPRKLADFYAEILGGKVEVHDDGITEVAMGEGQTRLHFQQADEPTPQPGWVHLDFPAANVTAATDAVLAAGGRLVEVRGDESFSWTVMADPEGNPFCF